VVNAATPVVVLTGALGAGKTTLLGRYLADPAFARTAVVIDELADLVVDPHLLSAAPGQVSRAPCGRWTDALRTLASSGRDFERVIVEANGVATPGRVVDDLAREEELALRFPLEGIVAAVDAAAGDAGLADAHARAHAAGADAIVLTKHDIADARQVTALVGALTRLNPYAEILRGPGAALARESPWEAARHAPGRELRRLQARVDDGELPQVGALCVRFAQCGRALGLLRTAGRLPRAACGAGPEGQGSRARGRAARSRRDPGRGRGALSGAHAQGVARGSGGERTAGRGARHSR